MKPKKKNASTQTSWLSFVTLIFSFIYMNIMKLFLKPQRPEPALVPPAPAAKTTMKLQKALTTPQPHLKATQRTRTPTPVLCEPSTVSIPLLTFSTAIEKKAAIPADVDVKETLAVDPKNPRNMQIDILFTNINLATIIKTKFKLLQQMTILDIPTQPLATLIHQLAFVYRFHILLTSLKVLMADGVAREDFYHTRSLLVHNTDNYLLDFGILHATQTALMNIDLSEIDELNYIKQKLNGERFTAAIKALPLCQTLNHQLDIQPIIKGEQLSKWLKSDIIPLLNSIDQHARNKEFPIRQECMDACKMVSIIAGEFCPPSTRIYNRKPSTIASFANLCLKNRKQFAHYVLTNKINHDNDALVALGKKITTNKIKDAQLHNCLSPFKHQPPTNITHQSHTNDLKRSGVL